MNSQSKTQASPVVLFLGGPNRIIPVWLDNLKVTEEAFDPNLNPLRVKIELSMRVRNLSELKRGSFGYTICASHLDRRRMHARLYNENKVTRDLLRQVPAVFSKTQATKNLSQKNKEKKD